MHCCRVSLDCLVNLELRVNQVIKVLLATLEEMDRMEREVQKVILVNLALQVCLEELVEMVCQGLQDPPVQWLRVKKYQDLQVNRHNYP